MDRRAKLSGGRREKCSTYLFGVPVTLTDVIAIPQELKNLGSSSLFFLQLLHLQRLSTATSLLAKKVKSLLNKLDILDAELLVDDGQITAGIDVTLNVDDLGIIEAANHLEDGIDSADVRQERVTQTGSGRGTAGETGNIVHGQVGGNLRLGLVVLAEPVEPLIGNDDTGLLGVNGGIWEIGRVTEGGLGDGLEECRLADIGKTNLKPYC